MRKLVISNYGHVDSRGALLSGDSYEEVGRLGERMKDVLYGMDCRILSCTRPDAAPQSAEVLRKHIGAGRVEATDYLNVDERKLTLDLEYYESEMGRISSMLSELEHEGSTDGIVLVMQKAATNTLPSYIARHRNFRQDNFYPFLLTSQAMSLDMEKGEVSPVYPVDQELGGNLNL